jgi:Integrase core domain
MGNCINRLSGSGCRTNPGSPTENALCERMNRIIREKLNEMMVRNNSNEWLAHLQTVVDNTNNQVAGGTNYTPNELWTPLYQAGHHCKFYL